MTELISELHENLLSFTSKFLGVILSDFFHSFRIGDTNDHHLMFNLLTDSSGKLLGKDNIFWFTEVVVSNISNTKTSSEGEI